MPASRALTLRFASSRITLEFGTVSALIISGHRNRSVACLLYPQKRTLRWATVMSALCQ